MALALLVLHRVSAASSFPSAAALQVLRILLSFLTSLFLHQLMSSSLSYLLPVGFSVTYRIFLSSYFYTFSFQIPTDSHHAHEVRGVKVHSSVRGTSIWTDQCSWSYFVFLLEHNPLCGDYQEH